MDKVSVLDGDAIFPPLVTKLTRTSQGVQASVARSCTRYALLRQDLCSQGWMWESRPDFSLAFLSF